MGSVVVWGWGVTRFGTGILSIWMGLVCEELQHGEKWEGEEMIATEMLREGKGEHSCGMFIAVTML